MYSRYFPPEDTFLPLPLQEEEQVPPPPPQPRAAPMQPSKVSQPMKSRAAQPLGAAGDLLGGLTQEVNKLLSGTLGKFSLENLDSGDILLILIVLYLFMEGDDLDLAIALGLTLLLSLGESGQDTNAQADEEPSHREE